MSKNRAILVFLIVIFTFPAIVAAQTEIKLTLPSFVGLFGLGPKTDVAITNATPFYGESIIAFHEKVGELPPGSSAHDRWSFEFDYTEMPVAVRFYEWDGNSCGDFVGIAADVLSIRRGRPTSWVIHTSDVKRPDGRRVSYGFGYGQTSYPAPEVEDGTVEVDFPRIGLKSTTALQFVNVTLFEARIRINGQEVSRLETGGVFYLAFWNKYDRTIPVEAEVIFTDRGRLVGYYEAAAHLGTSPRAIQYVLTPDKIRRY